MTSLVHKSGASAEFYAPADNKYPFSEAVRVGDTLYLAGQIGIAPEGLVPGFEPQVRRMMENVEATLRSLGLAMEHLVMCKVFMADLSKWNDFNEIYVSYFNKGLYPARSAFGATELALGAHVEIECIASFPVRK